MCMCICVCVCVYVASKFLVTSWMVIYPNSEVKSVLATDVYTSSCSN